MGMIPEALCGEAPKGQPVIRRENLVAVGVEAPQGQPRIHRPHPKQPSTRPPGEEEKPKSRGKSQDPPSSRWTRAAVKERGDRSPERMRGESGQCGKTWVAM